MSLYITWVDHLADTLHIAREQNNYWTKIICLFIYSLLQQRNVANYIQQYSEILYKHHKCYNTSNISIHSHQRVRMKIRKSIPII